MKAAPAPRNKIDDLKTNLKLALKNNHYKEAIISLKELLKLDRRPEWEQGLADAYRQRALQVAAKGMWQEAIILWDNYAKLDPNPVIADAYLGWLVQAGQFPKLVKLLADTNVGLDGPIGKRLPETLAVLALQNEKLLAALPLEHPIAKHYPIVKHAIRAYSAGRDEESEEALKQIPSRSPYRNIRTLLKALLLMGQDRGAGLELLKRIEEDSACRSFARMLLRQAQATGPDIATLSELPPKQHTLIHKINGYSKDQLKLLRDAKKVTKGSSQRLLFNTVLNNRVLLGESSSRRFCLAMLVHFPEGIDLFQKAFGTLTAFQRQRIRALHEETQGNYPQAVSHWRNAIDELSQLHAQESDRLDEALICRRIAKLAEAHVPEIAIDALQHSLKFDPDDQASYVALIRINEKNDAPKEAQEWLEKGLKRFPKDVELLILAMNTANRRKAFKKAASLAKTLLEIDPINSSARQLLIGAHIGHARKQFRAGRFALVQQELDQARALDPHRRNASLRILEGLSALLQHGKKQAAAMLAEGWNLAGDGLCAQFQVNVETLSTGQTLLSVEGLFPSLKKNYSANRTELSELAKLIGQYYAVEKKSVSDALKPLKTILKKSFKQSGLGKDDFFNLGQAFAGSAQFDLLGECATAAAQQFYSWPAAVYFQVYAKCKGVATRLTPADEDRLENAMNYAHRTKDHRTEMLIESFFRELDEAEESEHDDDFPPGFDGVDPARLPAIMQRIMEMEDLSRTELLRIVSKRMPGLPVKQLTDMELLDIAKMLTMEEYGID